MNVPATVAGNGSPSQRQSEDDRSEDRRRQQRYGERDDIALHYRPGLRLDA